GFNTPTLAASNTNVTTTNVRNVNVDGAPFAGSNESITNDIALNVGSSVLNASVVNSYGLYVNANTGATNNYAATFMGGNVGIGTTNPGALLDIGLAGTTLGTMRLESSTAASYVQIQPSTTAGSWTMTLPNTAPAVSGYV